MPLSLILIRNLLPWTAAHMRSSLPWTETHTRRWWPLWGMPNNGFWWQLQSWKKGWNKSAAPAAAYALAATNAGGPGPQDIKKEIPRQLPTVENLRPDQKIPRQTPTKEEGWMSTSTSSCPGWLHAEGVALEDGPSHPVPPGRSIGWPSPKGDTLPNRKEPGTQCQCRWGLPVVPANIAYWGGMTWRSQLVEAKGRGWDHPSWGRWRPGESPSTGTSPWTTPGWRGAIPRQCWGGRWTAASADINAQRSRTLFHVPIRVDRVAWQACGDANLVEGTHKDLQSQRLPGVCPKSACLLWGD